MVAIAIAMRWKLRLGAKRATTGMNGAVSESCTSLPFGDGGSCTSTNWSYFNFTDDEHDSESNLEHTWFRQLSTTEGRWLSPDPYSGSMDLTDPQSLNRYAYVGNGPVNKVDPLGLVTPMADCDTHLDARCYFDGGRGGENWKEFDLMNI